MITIRKSSDRGHFDHGWLNTYHTFSFDQYYDPNHMGFRSLRVINEDRVQPGTEFPTHPHRDMEIITYVVDGELSHKDSMGNGSVIRPGEIQKMSAGRGILHSERNSSPDHTTHLLQIWILPNQRGLTPDYGQIKIDDSARHNALLEIASPATNGGPAADGSTVKIHQDARLYTCRLDAGRSIRHHLEDNRHVWLQLINGLLTLNGHSPDRAVSLEHGDGVAISNESDLTIEATRDAEFLLFDLA